MLVVELKKDIPDKQAHDFCLKCHPFSVLQRTSGVVECWIKEVVLVGRGFQYACSEQRVWNGRIGLHQRTCSEQRVVARSKAIVDV